MSMNWFDGSIASAISTAKSKNSIFMVFIEDDDDESKQMLSIYNDTEISAKLKEANFVAIKFKANSVEFNQFGQIFPVVVIPSSYFIAGNGVPIEIIGGAVEKGEMMEKLQKIIQMHKDLANVSKDQESSQPAQSSTERAASSHSASDDGPSTSAQASDSAETNVSTEESDAEKQKRIDRAQELIKNQRDKRLHEQQQKEIEKEKERIKLGQDMQKFKQKQKEDEAKQLADDIAKERADNKMAKEKVKAQIAKDREERAVRYNKEKDDLEKFKKEKLEKLRKEQEEAEALSSQRSSVARIQFRLPDGSCVNESFPAEETLDKLRTYISETRSFNPRQFTMSTSFPRREFTENDMCMSLRDLQLAPSSVIIILPIQSAIQNMDSSFTSIFWTMMRPFMYVVGLVQNFLFGQPSNRSSVNADSNQRKRNKNPDEQQPSSSQTNKRRAVDKSSSVKIGNIHRFKNDSEDDDNNTWNGNSTQQM